MRPITIISLLVSIIPHLVSAHSWTPDDVCPTEIKVTIPNGRSDFGTMVSVHDALSHCPNISSLDLRVTLNGCSSWPDRWNFPFSYNGGETYPTLKKLRLDGYDFSSVESTRPPWLMPRTVGLFDWLKRGHWKPWLQAQVYGMPQLAPPKSNLDLWLGAMNWSEIDELAIDGCEHTNEVIAKIPPYLHSLRRLESTNIPFIEALPNNTITHLTWVGPHKHGDLANILDRQGATLQELEFRCNEMGCPLMRNKFNLSIIPDMAPNLMHLSVNIPRNGSWPLDSFHTIASLPQLRSLEIYSNLQSDCQRQKPEPYTKTGLEYLKEYGMNYCRGEDQFQEPLLNENSAEDLFYFIQQANVGGALQNVTFRIGDWTPPWDGPLYFPPWIEDRKVEIVCSARGEVEGERRCELIRSYGYWPPESNTGYDDDYE